MVFSGLGPTHRPLSSSFLELPYRVLNTNHKKELLRGLWVNPKNKSLYGTKEAADGHSGSVELRLATQERIQY